MSTVTAYQANGVNLSAATGRVAQVVNNGPGQSSGLVQLSVAAGALPPAGIVRDAENDINGLVGVVVDGYAYAIAGAALTVGTHFDIGSDINGAVVPIAAGAGVWAVGFFDPESGTDAAATELVRIRVFPHFVPVS